MTSSHLQSSNSNAGALKRPKPDPAGVHLILNAWDLPTETVAYIGDSALDERSAAAAGVAFWSYKNPALAAAMEAPEDDVLRARVAVMGPVASKGLEYDTVVLVDPVALGAVSPGDLYVAMTRPTRRLRVVSRLPLPVGLT